MPIRIDEGAVLSLAYPASPGGHDPVTWIMSIKLLKLPPVTKSIIGEGRDADTGGWENSLIVDTGGGLTYRSYDGGNRSCYAGQLRLGKWVQVAATTRSNVGLYAYNDGVLVGSSGFNTFQSGSNARRARVGGRTAAGVSGSDQTPPLCLVKDVAWWFGQYLSDAEIAMAGKGVPITQLPSYKTCSAYWPCEPPMLTLDPVKNRSQPIIMEGPVATSQIPFFDFEDPLPYRYASLEYVPESPRRLLSGMPWKAK